MKTQHTLYPLALLFIHTFIDKYNNFIHIFFLKAESECAGIYAEYIQNSQRFLYKYQISASFYGKIKFVRFHFDNDDHFYSKDALLGPRKRDSRLEEH